MYTTIFDDAENDLRIVRRPHPLEGGRTRFEWAVAGRGDVRVVVTEDGPVIETITTVTLPYDALRDAQRSLTADARGETVLVGAINGYRLFYSPRSPIIPPYFTLSSAYTDTSEPRVSLTGQGRGTEALVEVPAHTYAVTEVADLVRVLTVVERDARYINTLIAQVSGIIPRPWSDD